MLPKRKANIFIKKTFDYKKKIKVASNSNQNYILIQYYTETAPAPKKKTQRRGAGYKDSENEWTTNHEYTRTVRFWHKITWLLWDFSVERGIWSAEDGSSRRAVRQGGDHDDLNSARKLTAFSQSWRRRVCVWIQTESVTCAGSRPLENGVDPH